MDNSGNIYATFSNDTQKLYYLLAYDSRGIMKWRFSSPITTAPVIGPDGTIYFGADKKFFAVNPDGTLKWERQFAALGLNDPTIGADSIIYVGSWDKHLYAVNPDGTLAWQFETEEGVEGAPIIAPDGLLVCCAGNTIYGIQTTSRGLSPGIWPTRGHDNQRTYNLNSTIVIPETGKIENNILAPFYPNPFNSVTTIRFQIPEHRQSGDLKLLINNLLGEKIQRFDLNASLKKELQWDGTNYQQQMVASGTYLALLTDGNWRKTLKLIYLR